MCTPVFAQPYEPASDGTVLIHVPAATGSRQTQSLRRALASNPQDLNAALELARAWLDAGRREGDPRFFSYVQATLAPWIEREDAPVDALVLAATSLQSLHRFGRARSLLDRALAINPRHAQAWLTKATLLQLSGDFAGARKACSHLLGVADHRVALGCVLSAQSMDGRLAESYATLSRIMTNDNGLNDATLSWLTGLRGEMAVRLGELAEAEHHFESALGADPEDSYARGELADLYLRQSRHAEVVTLLMGHESHDALLLRLAIAGKHLNTSAGRRWMSMYDARYRAAQRANDGTHVREHARYLLEVLGDFDGAFKAAQRNWRAQREPADIRLYRQSATASGHSPGVIDAWIARHRYEDAALEPSARTTEVLL
jgi:Tfp pilus assembly protein PilF